MFGTCETAHLHTIIARIHTGKKTPSRHHPHPTPIFRSTYIMMMCVRVYFVPGSMRVWITHCRMPPLRACRHPVGVRAGVRPRARAYAFTVYKKVLLERQHIQFTVDRSPERYKHTHENPGTQEEYETAAINVIIIYTPPPPQRAHHLRPDLCSVYTCGRIANSSLTLHGPSRGAHYA